MFEDCYIEMPIIKLIEEYEKEIKLEEDFKDRWKEKNGETLLSSTCNIREWRQATNFLKRYRECNHQDSISISFEQAKELNLI